MERNNHGLPTRRPRRPAELSCPLSTTIPCKPDEGRDTVRGTRCGLLVGGRCAGKMRCEQLAARRRPTPRPARLHVEHLFLSPARQPRPSTLLSTDTSMLSRFSSMRSTSCMSLAVGLAKFQVPRKSPPAPRHGSTCTFMTSDVPHRQLPSRGLQRGRCADPIHV